MQSVAEVAGRGRGMNGFVMMVTPRLISADAVPAGLRQLAQKLASNAMLRTSGRHASR